MAIQTVYNETMDAARAGAIASTEHVNLISRNVEDAAGVGFGKVVQQGANDNGCTSDLDTSDMTATSFVGITVRDRSVDPANPDKFAQYASARIITKGPIWVTASGTVAAGDAVYVTLATGVYTNASGAGKVQIPNARFDTSATDALAVVRLG